MSQFEEPTFRQKPREGDINNQAYFPTFRKIGLWLHNSRHGIYRLFSITLAIPTFILIADGVVGFLLGPLFGFRTCGGGGLFPIPGCFGIFFAYFMPFWSGTLILGYLFAALGESKFLKYLFLSFFAIVVLLFLF